MLKAAENFMDMLILLTFTIFQESGIIHLYLQTKFTLKFSRRKDEIKNTNCQITKLESNLLHSHEYFLLRGKNSKEEEDKEKGMEKCKRD